MVLLIAILTTVEDKKNKEKNNETKKFKNLDEYIQFFKEKEKYLDKDFLLKNKIYL